MFPPTISCCTTIMDVSAQSVSQWSLKLFWLRPYGFPRQHEGGWIPEPFDYRLAAGTASSYWCHSDFSGVNTLRIYARFCLSSRTVNHSTIQECFSSFLYCFVLILACAATMLWNISEAKWKKRKTSCNMTALFATDYKGRQQKPIFVL